jgi:hypothetical protein
LEDHFAVDGLGERDIGLGCDGSTEDEEECGFFHDGVIGFCEIFLLIGELGLGQWALGFSVSADQQQQGEDLGSGGSLHGFR